MHFAWQFILANDTAYIRFYDAHGHPVYFLDIATSQLVYPNNRTLTFYTSGIILKPGHHYYILIDEGIVMGTGNCRPESPPIHLPWEYRFSVGKSALMINGSAMIYILDILICCN